MEIKIKILVVDDNSDMLLLIGFALTRLSHKIGVPFKVFKAKNGVEALNVFNNKENGKVDLIITDLDMPEMDGIELVKNVRVHEIGRLIPIIFMTGNHLSNKQRGELDEMNVLVRLAKPFTYEELCGHVKDALKSHLLTTVPIVDEL